MSLGKIFSAVEKDFVVRESSLCISFMLRHFFENKRWLIQRRMLYHFTTFVFVRFVQRLGLSYMDIDNQVCYPSQVTFLVDFLFFTL